MLDANQVWEVPQAIEWMKKLAEFKPTWIEEPTSPDDVLGHQTISKALKPHNIGVATGEMCANRVMFKQFLQAEAMQYCQIDACRLGGINEIIAVYLMAKKLNGKINKQVKKLMKILNFILFLVKVCPHAGGVGLCEMVQHLQMWDYVSLSGSMEDRWIEYVDQQHEHFENPVVMKDAHYQTPTVSYSTIFIE